MHLNDLLKFTQRRAFLRQSAGLLGTGLFTSQSPLSFANMIDEMDEVRIGYLPITDATALLIAHANGLFEKEGLKVAPPMMVKSWPKLIQGFLSGRFNVVHLLKPIPVWLRYNHNFPVKIMSWAHINGSAIVTGKHINAEKFEDLAGKQIAVPYWYSMHNIVLQMSLRHVGLKPVVKAGYEKLAANEVNLRVLPPPLMVWALKAQNIDAYIVAEPINAKGELLAGARLLRFTGDIWRNHPCCVVCMDERVTQQQPEWTQKVMNAIVKAQAYAQQNKLETAKILSTEGQAYIPADEKVLRHGMTAYGSDYQLTNAIKHPDWDSGRIDFAPWPYPSATHLLIDSFPETLFGSPDVAFIDQLEAEHVIDDLVDYDFVSEAMDVCHGWKKAPGIDLADPFKREEVIQI
ncbi:ABC transporter substrate-binding protein [Candidatus Albibeggiatoa sp. nov. NOAA]|uniref:ABC transporter substrate-binding protein n=1 Tax=Candidatus Albibeggiatoa sp. nov. NOAA TaxID=3162724 RepID=UPI0032F9D621|nr:ABC transporter substrate-binding protein [Thiotrichaceae bacterium]